MSLSWLVSPLSGVVDVVGDWFKSNRELKKKELESKLKVMEARSTAIVELYKSGVVGDIAWENSALTQSGWKGNYWTLLISVPCILCWFPEGQAWVKQGFDALSATPDWYQVIFGGAISTAFGLRKVMDFMAVKNGVNISKLEEVKKIAELTKLDQKSTGV